MGLDQYAHIIKKELIEDTEQTDINLTSRAVKAAGFTGEVLPYEKEYDLPEKERKAYQDKCNTYWNKAKEEGIIDTDFAYWRKFNHLHGWMEKLYYSKGGKAESFNCVNVRLTEQDLNTLQKQAEAMSLKPTEGFFFGSYEEFTEDDKDSVMTFINKAREAINGGYAIFYDSWW